MRIQLFKPSFATALMLSSLLIISGCKVTLVQPYDAKLLADTEAFYKKAAGVIEEGRSVSPKTDQERRNIANPSKHKAGFAQFESKYNDLLVDSEALILRAMAGSNAIDATGQAIQAKLDDIIETNIPSVCQGLAAEFGQTSLTAKNYIDLKCIIIKWKEQHADPRLTQDTMILKKANWEGRKTLIFNVILAIQKAEGFKNKDQQQQ